MEFAHWRDLIQAEADVTLKPNLTSDYFLPGRAAQVVQFARAQEEGEAL